MTIGETVLSAFLQALFQQLLTTGGSQFLKLIGGVDLPKTIKQWERQLIRMEALLDDAVQKQFHDKSIKLWLNDLQDLAYDMEDVLDHFATQARLYELRKADDDQHTAVDDQQSSGIMDSMVKSICASGSRAADTLSTLLKPVDQDILRRIDDITDRLQDIQNQTRDLSLTAVHMMQQQTLQTETLRRQRESTSLVSDVFGRDKLKQEVITKLQKEEQSAANYVVIPIVGTGGIGKTTLAQYVYNDEQKLKGHFDLKAWVCVSDVFDVKRVTKDIIDSATHSNFDCSNLDQAQVKLQQVLKGQKFFIVLDDIWSENYDDWDKLQEPFKHGARGSRVIMTTRIEKIAKMMIKNHNTIIRLAGLSSDDCWRLFQHHANKDTDLAEMRDDIVRKCKGSPLAAKALGGLLKSITEKSRCQKILESNIWYEDSKECSVLPVLRLSYHHLPYHQKRVFAYCSVFPKDYKFEKMEVILLWMAQGLLTETQIDRMEDIGHRYFDDLVSRSLIEQSPGRSIWFIMHDLIHDMAQLAAGDVCYVMDTMDTRRDLKRTRHLFLNGQVETLGNQVMAPQLRTVICKNGSKIEISNFFQNLCYLRTLSLHSDDIEVLPECIGDLTHLRYLELRFKSIKVLPQSINNLLNLQTLRLNGCEKLEKVPNISLVKLRHLFIVGTCLQEMPLGIEKLTSLQTLEEFVLAAGGGSRIRELGKLNHLHGNLTITGLENVTEVDDADEAQLYKKENLDKLYLRWGTCTDGVDNNNTQGEDVLEQLKPHTSIKECELEGYRGSRLPGWLGDPSFNNMVRIRLSNCQGVQSLKFEDSSSSSCRLQELWVSDCPKLESLVGEFTLLNNLFIINCSTFRKFPEGGLPRNLRWLVIAGTSIDKPIKEWGLHLLTSLEYITLKNVGSSMDTVECISDSDLPSSLSELQIEGFQNLKTICCSTLPCLYYINIKSCPKFESLGESGLPPRMVYIEECDLIQRHLKSDPDGCILTDKGRFSLC